MGYFTTDALDLAAFQALTSQQLDPAAVPLAAKVDRNVPCYDMRDLAPALTDTAARRALMSEWAQVLGDGAGVLVLKAAYADTAPVDRASDVFRTIIAEERATSGGKGDHFAAAGANDRVWNALQKHCLHDPEGFALYFGNPAIAAVAEAWLGPGYQMTAQVNQVRPGGKAQQAHRDYHLGFQTADRAACYPDHVHRVSTMLTLQGGVAHCDMPVESGPTKLLPFSQLYAPGYLAFHDDDHRDWFETAHIQLPLDKGDAVFFNPALFHAAGENRSTGIARMVNLLQISSAFGRAMETVDRAAMAQALLPVLVALKQSGRMNEAELSAAIAASAEAYAFPTNLDTDPPRDGLAPTSQADLLADAIASAASPQTFAADLAAQTRRRLA